MNEKQQEIIFHYKKIKKQLDDLLEMRDYDYFSQDNFLTNIDRLRVSLAEFSKISVRGAEQWEYWFGLSEKDFREVVDFLKGSK